MAGPDPDDLMQPTVAGLEAAQQAATALQQLMDLRSEGDDLASFGAGVLKAVKQLKLVAWDSGNPYSPKPFHCSKIASA